MKFNLGQIVATPGAIEALKQANVLPSDLLDKHKAGDWGVLDNEDWNLNDAALKDGGRLLSSYQITPDVKVWIITEAEDDNGNRSTTTILTPQEY